MTNQLFHNAVSAIEREDYSIALDLLNKIITEGDLLKPHALHFMAWMYEQGLGVTRDPRASFDFLMQAAFLNVSESQIGLAECYKLGKGVESNNLKSYAWYTVALTNPDNQRVAYVREQLEKIKTQFSTDENEEANKLIHQIKNQMPDLV